MASKDQQPSALSLHSIVRPADGANCGCKKPLCRNQLEKSSVSTSAKIFLLSSWAQTLTLGSYWTKKISLFCNQWSYVLNWEDDLWYETTCSWAQVRPIFLIFLQLRWRQRKVPDLYKVPDVSGFQNWSSETPVWCHISYVHFSNCL